MRTALFIAIYSLFLSVSSFAITADEKVAMLKNYLNTKFSYRPQDNDPFYKKIKQAFITSNEVRDTLLNAKLAPGPVPMVAIAHEKVVLEKISEILIKETSIAIRNGDVPLEEKLKLADLFLDQGHEPNVSLAAEKEKWLRHLDQAIHNHLLDPQSNPIAHPRLIARMQTVYPLLEYGLLQRDRYIDQWIQYARAGKPYSQNYYELLQTYLKDAIQEHGELDASSARILEQVLDEGVHVDRSGLHAYMISLKSKEPKVHAYYAEKFFRVMNTREKVRAVLEPFRTVGRNLSENLFFDQLMDGLNDEGFFKNQFRAQSEVEDALFKTISAIYQKRTRPIGSSIAKDYFMLEQMGFFKSPAGKSKEIRGSFRKLILEKFKTDDGMARNGIPIDSDPISPKAFDYVGNFDGTFKLAYEDKYIKNYVLPMWLADDFPEGLVFRDNFNEYGQKFHSWFDSDITPERIAAIDQFYTRYSRWGGGSESFNPQLKVAAELMAQHTPKESLARSRARVVSAILDGSLNGVSNRIEESAALRSDFRRTFKDLVKGERSAIFKQFNLAKHLLELDLKMLYSNESEFLKDILEFREKVLFKSEVKWQDIVREYAFDYKRYQGMSTITHEFLRLVNATHFQLSQIDLNKVDSETLARLKKSVEWNSVNRSQLTQFYGKLPQDEVSSIILHENIDRVLFDRKIITLEEYQDSFSKLTKWSERMGGVELEMALGRDGFSERLKKTFLRSIKSKERVTAGINRILDGLAELKDPNRYLYAHQNFSQNLNLFEHEFKNEIMARFEKLPPPALPKTPPARGSFIANLLKRWCK